MTLENRAQPLETRDPKAATTQLYYTGRDMPMVPKWNPANAISNAYEASWIVNRCVDIVAGDVCALPFRAGLDPDKPNDYNTAAPLARLLGPPPGGPAPGLTSEVLIRWLVAQYLVTGQMACEIESNPQGQPAFLWPLTAANLRAIPTSSGSSWWREFEYGPLGDNPKKLKRDEVFYYWRPALSDFRQPYSPLTSARLDVSVHVMMGRYSYGFYANGAVPATVVSVPEFPNEDAKAAWLAKYNAQFQGTSNAGRTLVNEVGEGEGSIGDAIDIKQIGLSQKDARQLDHQRYLDESIAGALGVPFSRINASGRTFDNAGEEGKTYWQSTVLEVVRALQGAINMGLAPRLGPELGWFDLSNVDALRVQPEPATARVGAPALVQAGIMTFNEARAEYGLPAVNGGDVLLTPDQASEWTAGTDQLPPPSRGVVVPNPAGVPTPSTRATATTPELLDRSGLLEIRRAKIWKSADATVRTLERQWERAFTKLFTRQAKSTISNLEAKRGHKMIEQRGPADAVFDPEYWTKETRQLSADLYELVTTQGLLRVSDAFGISFDLGAEGVDEFITSRANQLAGGVTDTTYQQIQDALTAGVSEGESIPDLAARVSHVFDVATESRATTIARTEVISAYNGSATLGAEMLPADVAAGQEWISTRDARTREEHTDADGQVVAIGDSFEVDGENLAYPGDPAGSAGNVINCRCTIAILTPDEYDAAKEDGRTRGRLIDVRSAKRMLALVKETAA